MDNTGNVVGCCQVSQISRGHFRPTPTVPRASLLSRRGLRPIASRQHHVGAVAKQQRISVPIPTQKPMAPPSMRPQHGGEKNGAGRAAQRPSPARSGSARFRFSSLDVPPSPRLSSHLVVRRERVAQLPQQRQLGCRSNSPRGLLHLLAFGLGLANRLCRRLAPRGLG